MIYTGLAPKWKSKSAPGAQDCSDRKMLKSQSPRTAKVDSNGVDLDDRESGEKSADFCTILQKIWPVRKVVRKLHIFAVLSPSGENQCV